MIDHGATFVPGDPKKSIELAAGPKGDFIYRFGNSCVYDSGDCPSLSNDGQRASNGNQQMFFTHDVHWIDDGLPGAGHFLIFDNGARRPGETFSSILEINPYDGPMGKGVYVPEVEAGYARSKGKAPEMISKQVVWSYKSNSTQSFFSGHISGSQRLPNGNTMICSGRWGHFFEVTPKGECVWEYVSPVNGSSVTKLIGDVDPMGGTNVFRAHRYAPDYPGLKGKDLTPQGPITKVHAHLMNGGGLPVDEIPSGGPPGEGPEGKAPGGGAPAKGKVKGKAPM